MRSLRLTMAVLAALIAILATMTVTPALGAPGSAVVIDCNAHGQLTHHYSTAELKAALNNIPVDVREYTNCVDVIRSQLLAQLHGSSGPAGGTANSSGGGSFLSTGVIVVLVIVLV